MFLYFCDSKSNHSVMKRLLLFLGFTLMFASLNAQETYRFRTDAPQGFSVTSSTASQLSLHFSIQELGIANIENGDVKGQEIILKGQFAPNAEGHPNLPVVNRYVAIPQGATVSLQVKENASTMLTDIDLLPAMPARTDLAEGELQLRWDAGIFGNDADFPTENTVLSTPTQIRSLDVVMLSVTPFRYNPVRKTLEVIYDIDIDIRFEGGNGQFGESRYFNPDWQHILRGLVINSDMIPSTDYYSLVKEARDRDNDGWEYLIISPDDPSILAWADTLKAFRTKQGISTKVVTVTECGGNSANVIRNYILNAYNNWAIPPAAVLIFGGWRNNVGVRPFYHVTVADSSYNSRRYPTDYPYCDMNGDSLADLAVSRITARDLDEYRIFVEKTIQYETHPSTDPNYYDRPIFSTGHEDNKWFLISSQSVIGFFRDKVGKHPNNLYMVNSGSFPTTTWSTGYNASVLLDYFGPNGQNYVPETPEYLDDWRSKSDSVMLYDAINAGAFLTTYRDHSNYNAWWCPTFKSIYIDSEIYGPPTFVFSISCSTTLFTESGRCIIDAFCVKENSGAVGGIGAGSLTHSYFNDILEWGMFDCIWPDFLPDQGNDTPPEFVRPSFFLAEAKHYYAYHTFLPGWWPDVDQSQMNLFNYFGETYLNLFTELPQTIDITHELYCRANSEEFLITAEEGAVVCLSIDGEIMSVFNSDGQIHTVFLPPTEVGEHLTVTATKQNHFRYEYDVPIIPSSGPYVAIDRDGFLIENDYDVLHSGENAHIGLKLHNYGSNTANNVTISLSCDSPYIEITQGNSQLQNIAANQTVTLSNAFRFIIADDIPDMTEVTFTFHINDGGGSKELNVVQNIAAPLFVVKPDITYKNASQQSVLQLVGEGRTDIHVKVANEGHFNSGPVLMRCEMQAPFISVNTPSFTIDALDKGCTNEVVFSVQAEPSDFDQAWVNAIIQVNDGIRQVTLDTLLPYGGFNESFDPDYFNTHDWRMTGDADWIVTDETSHSGDYCSKSGVITHNESSSMSITQTILPNTEISFFKKLSTETNYDKLHFYIDDEDMGEWSGLMPWKEERFNLPAGEHTMKWTYAKDYSVNLGHDCVWLDDINIWPPHTAIAYSGGTITACANESVLIDCNYAYDYRSLAWSTEGDGTFDASNTLHPVYTPGPNDIANGGATLQFSADTVCSTLQLIITDHIDLGNEIEGNDVIDEGETISHYSVAKVNGVEYQWQIEPAEAGFIINQGNAVDIVWDLRNGPTNATLSVTSASACVQTLSKDIQINLVSIAEDSPSSFSVYPNPTHDKANLIIAQDLPGKSVVEIYNVLGTRMAYKTYRNLTKGQSVAIDLQHYAPGIYIIKLSTENGSCCKKVSVN